MRKTLVCAAAAAYLGMAGSAVAGGMYEGEGSMKDAPAPMPPVHIWAGLYVGGSAGFGVGDTSGQLNFHIDDKILEECGDYEKCQKMMHEIAGHQDNLYYAQTASIEPELSASAIEGILESIFQEEYDINGAIYGAHVGYNWQHGQKVFGLEAGINGTDIDGNSNCGVLFNLPTCERELDYYGTLVGRLGYAVNNFLFYGFGGVAWGEVETDVSVFGETLFDGSETHVGWTAGLGLEVAMTERFFVGVEYAHVDLGEETFNVVDENYIKIDNEVDVQFDVFKVRASYKLWDRAHEPLESFK